MSSSNSITITIPSSLFWTVGATTVAGFTAYVAYHWLWGPLSSLLTSNKKKPQSVTVQDSLTHFTDYIIPSQCGASGVVFGGELLSLMDLVGGSVAVRHCRGAVVTKTMEHVHFLNPAMAHDILVMRGRINAAFGSSVEVEVLVQAEDPVQGTVRTCCTGRMVFVHLGNHQHNKTTRSQPVPKLELVTEEERERAQAATLRREQRLAETKQEEANANGGGGISWWMEQWKTKDEPWLRTLQCSKTTTPITFVPMADTEVQVSKVVLPQHANPLQICFGGQIMAWMEQAAAISAGRFCRKDYTVTVGLDRMSFQKPCHVGDLLQIEAKITRVFGTSLEVRVAVRALSIHLDGGNDSIRRDNDTYNNTAYFTLVAIGRPKTAETRNGTLTSTTSQEPSTRLSPLLVGKQVLPNTDEEKREFCEALRRREVRLRDKKVLGLDRINSVLTGKGPSTTL